MNPNKPPLRNLPGEALRLPLTVFHETNRSHPLHWQFLP
jgi:hypothetical protein